MAVSFEVCTVSGFVPPTDVTEIVIVPADWVDSRHQTACAAFLPIVAIFLLPRFDVHLFHCHYAIGSKRLRIVRSFPEHEDAVAHLQILQGNCSSVLQVFLSGLYVENSCAILYCDGNGRTVLSGKHNVAAGNRLNRAKRTPNGSLRGLLGSRALAI